MITNYIIASCIFNNIIEYNRIIKNHIDLEHNAIEIKTRFCVN